MNGPVYGILPILGLGKTGRLIDSPNKPMAVGERWFPQRKNRVSYQKKVWIWAGKNFTHISDFAFNSTFGHA